MVLSKIFDRSIQIPRRTHKKKIKSAIPYKQNYMARLVKNGKTVFSTLTQKISHKFPGIP